MIVVDTNVWSELIRDEPDRNVRVWEETNAHRLWMSTIVLAEFRARIALMPPGRRRDQIEALTDEVMSAYQDRLLPFDEACSRQHGPVLLSARRAGKPIGSADALIAATALAHGMRVATWDGGDFAGAGVELIDPWRA